MVSIRSKRAFKAIFNDGGVDDMISKVDSERVLVEQVARLIYRQDLNEEQQKLLNQVENLRVPIEGIAAGVKEVVDATRLAKEKQVLDWISLIQFGKQHDRAGLGRLVDTGKWLLDDRAFENWISGESKDNLFWLHGIPGSGNTKLASLVVDRVKSVADPAVDAIVCFYCVRDTAEPERSQPAQIIRSIVCQLAFHVSTASVRKEAIELYETLTMSGLQAHDLSTDQALELISQLTIDLASVTIVLMRWMNAKTCLVCY
jgi:hypothetical protein